MTLSAARIRRWMLRAGPVMALGGLRWSAGGAAAGLALWLAVGWIFLRRNAYPYPRKRTLSLARLTFSAALCACCMAGLFSLLCGAGALEKSVGLLPIFLAWTGVLGFSLPLGVWVLRFSLPRRVSWIGTVIFCALFLWLIQG